MRGRGFGRSQAVLLSLSLSLAAGSGCSLPRLPVESPVTSPFGVRWNELLPRVHQGVDLRAPIGTPVRAMRAGRVRYAGWMNGYGNVVWVDHPGGVISVYAHLSEIQVTAGAPVEDEGRIGLSGNTGTTSGPHLHFEVWKAGRPVDPIAYLGVRP